MEGPAGLLVSTVVWSVGESRVEALGSVQHFFLLFFFAFRLGVSARGPGLSGLGAFGFLMGI